MLKTPLLAISYFLLGFVSCYLLRDRLWHDHENELFRSLQFQVEYSDAQREYNQQLSDDIATYAAYIDGCRIELGLQPYGTLEVMNKELK